MSLSELQTKVHVGKDKKNTFGGYNYRTAEGILAAAKAALPDGWIIICTDELQDVAGQIFVTSTAFLFNEASERVGSAQGHAMHPLTKKGMDPSQITGSASSYARKYALCGLLAIDDGSVDPDASKEPYEPASKEPEFNAPAAAQRIKDKLNNAGDGLAEAFKSEHQAINDIKDVDNGLYQQIINLKDQLKDDMVRKTTSQGAG